MSAEGQHGETVQGAVVRIAAEPKQAPRGGYLFRGLEVSQDGCSDRVFLMFPELIGEDLYGFSLLCWEGARIAAYNLQLNNRLDDGTVIYTAASESRFVLEPFRLISVTEAVEAASCIRSADMRYRVGSDEPFWMAKGRLIHTLFDGLLYNRQESWDDIFPEAYQQALPALMAMLPGSRVSPPDQDEFEKEARSHFDNLKSWLDSEHASFSLVGVEEDRMSTRWGLKGRADAILYNGNRSSILELKSGKVPVEDHRLQLQAYFLLFTRGAENSAPDGYLLYSASGRVESLDGTGNGIERTILEGRNRAISLKHSYTVEDTQVQDHDCPRKGRCFSRAACFRFFGNPSGADERSLNGAYRDYYDRWLRLLSHDAWVEEGDFARVLDPRTLEERIVEGITFPVSEIRVTAKPEAPVAARTNNSKTKNAKSKAQKVGEPAYSASATDRPGQLIVNLSLQDTIADVGPGEEVILHPGDLCSPNAMRGRVIDSEEGRTLLGLKVPFTPCSSGHSTLGQMPAFESQQDWYLDRIPFSRGREATRQALFRFLEKADPAVVSAVVDALPQPESAGLFEDAGTEIASSSAAEQTYADQTESKGLETNSDYSDDLCFSEGLQGELNQDQESAVRAALGCETFHLIHGPPGTGKTRVLARLIRICLDRGERVLVACPTNVALDRLLISLMNLGVRDFLRIGRRHHLSDEFLDAVGRCGTAPVLLEELATEEKHFGRFRQRVQEMRLIGATAYQCSAHPFFLRQRFDRVVVDEAGQLDEPSTLAPLTFAPKFVLGGDHLQLPPVVKTRGQDSTSEEDGGLRLSLFERLFLSAPPQQVSRLSMQYRMNLEVQSISSQLFYDGKLFPSPEAATRRLNIDRQESGDTQIEKIVSPGFPVVFVDVPGTDKGKSSAEEAAIVCKIVERLLAAGVPPHEVGIITPYKAQQALIRRCFLSRQGNLRSLSVDTVDRFQGGEREVIILSLARSDAVTSFLADPKRLNVSLSRARSKLILLGTASVLEEHPLFLSILDRVERISVG
jgi:DNA replication ATP-dependent helicase/nuclease Dna2